MAQTLSSSRRGVLFTPFPPNVYNYTVTTAANITVPAATTGVIIEADADIWLNTSAAATVGGTAVDGTGSIPLKAGVSRGFDVVPGQVISVISASGTAHVATEWFT
jgi:hypothetical protein